MSGVRAMLAVDAGNTRIKWGLATGDDWIARGAVDSREPERLGAAWAVLGPRPVAAIGCNVAGEAVRVAIEAAAAAVGLGMRWVTSRAAQCGVVSGYDDPGQLGADRWVAAIAAWRRTGGACVVVSAGTAITVDALGPDGRFRGGLILPGVDTMLHALEARTAGLRRAPGRYATFPANTADAMFTGAVDAAAGAVERLRARLGDEAGGPVPVILSGGAAGLLAPCLDGDVRQAESLVLEGLQVIAREEPVS
ncbi:MAG: type III pantothenate kinase [Betaproteobacteria bacterium]|nr:type III pantothenate kinase [Betaproteobacteria bacterium]